MNKISIAPNPIQETMQVMITTNSNNTMKLLMYDMSGKVLRKIEGNLQTGNNIITVHQLSELPHGMYLVVVYSGNEIFSQKVVLINSSVN